MRLVPTGATDEQEEKVFNSCTKKDHSISSPLPQPAGRRITVPAARL